MDDLTHIVNAFRQGSAGSIRDLPALLYEELRRMAAHRMMSESPGNTLQPTALVHEAWLRVVRTPSSAPFANRRHFFAAAGQAMRRILVDAARRKKRVKHGGHLDRLDFEEVEVSAPMPDEELLILDEAMERLTAVRPVAAEVVNLRFFAGLTLREASEILEISPATVERNWVFARAWLFHEIEKTRDSAE